VGFQRNASSTFGLCSVLYVKGMGECVLHNMSSLQTIKKEHKKIVETYIVKNFYELQKAHQ